MNYNVIATGSDGNATILDDEILVDCGIPFKALRPYIRELKLVLLTHEHSDHFRPSTVAALARERPALRWGCCDWMVPKLLEAGVDKAQIDVYTPYHHAKYSIATICPVPIPHNVPNCAYRIEFPGSIRAFYATDCGSLDDVTALNYDFYFVEANHRRAEIEERAAEKEAAGEYAYERRAAENHLSYEQATDWLTENMGPRSLWIPMHEHKDRRREVDAEQDH